MTSKDGVAYTYGENGAGPHAVTSIGDNIYTYDANGNMTGRQEAGGSTSSGPTATVTITATPVQAPVATATVHITATPVQATTTTYTWDVENRLIAVSGGASFVYDGDGNRIKKTESGETILYINKYYEKNLTTGVVTTNYYLGSKLIATRENTTLTYVHQDALTGTSVTTNSSGTSTGSIKYFSFGDCRNSTGNLPEQKFTGQRLDSTGLYYYGARYYDPSIGRFINADTIVPSPANPQSLNRYSYCLNNPLKYTDPSGHDQIIEPTGTTNAAGQEGYFICDGAGNLLSVAYGIDDLAAKMAGAESQSRGVDLTNSALTAAYGISYDLPVTNQSVNTNEPSPSQVLLTSIGQMWTSPNTLVGYILGEMSDGTKTNGPGGTIIYQNITSNSLTGKFMDSRNALAITFGYVILTEQTELQTDIRDHELGHVVQYSILGPFFLPIYGLDYLLSGCDYNKMRMETDRRPAWPWK
jgi:RHS repeat-associated protein